MQVKQNSNNQSKDFTVELSTELVDEAWDSFVESALGGEYYQTARWARVQATRGWNSLRIYLKSGDDIQGGAQILYRTYPIIGSMGYMSRGPVCDCSNSMLTKRLMDEIQKVRRQKQMIYLGITLPINGRGIAPVLTSLGFQKANQIYGEYATIAIDLSQEIETILARMKIDKRKTIHRVERRNELVIREGTQKDIPVFYQLHSSTSHRNGFTPHSEAFFEKLWEEFEPGGNLKLFFSEYQGEIVSTILCIIFNNTVIVYVLGWSGKYGNLNPNDALLWNTIKWAKEAGYRFLDFAGLEISCAKAVSRNEPLSDIDKHSYHLFKLGYGGDIFFYPDNYDNISNPILNWAHHSFPPIIHSTDWSAWISRTYHKTTEPRR